MSSTTPKDGSPASKAIEEGLVPIKDYKTLIMLMTSGIAHKKVIYDGDVLLFCFLKAEIEETLKKYLTTDVFMVNIYDVWRSMDTFKSYLSSRPNR